MAAERFDLAKCELCDKAFAYVVGSRSTCPDCVEEGNDLYARIRTLISDHPFRRMTVAEIAKTLGVEERKIIYLAELGLFDLIADEGSFGKSSDAY
jgi:hypothetical protein